MKGGYLLRPRVWEIGHSIPQMSVLSGRSKQLHCKQPANNNGLSSASLFVPPLLFCSSPKTPSTSPTHIKLSIKILPCRPFNRHTDETLIYRVFQRIISLEIENVWSKRGLDVFENFALWARPGPGWLTSSGRQGIAQVARAAKFMSDINRARGRRQGWHGGQGGHHGPHGGRKGWADHWVPLVMSTLAPPILSSLSVCLFAVTIPIAGTSLLCELARRLSIFLPHTSFLLFQPLSRLSPLILLPPFCW